MNKLLLVLEAATKPERAPDGSTFAIIGWVQDGTHIGWRTIEIARSYSDARLIAQSHAVRDEHLAMTAVLGQTPDRTLFEPEFRVETAFIKKDIARTDASNVDVKDKVYDEESFFQHIAPRILPSMGGGTEMAHAYSLFNLHNTVAHTVIENLVKGKGEAVIDMPAEPPPHVDRRIRNKTHGPHVYTFPQDFAVADPGEIVMLTEKFESAAVKYPRGSRWKVVSNDYKKGVIKLEQADETSPNTVVIAYGMLQERGIKDLMTQTLFDPNVFAWRELIKKKDASKRVDASLKRQSAAKRRGEEATRRREDEERTAAAARQKEEEAMRDPVILDNTIGKDGKYLYRVTFGTIQPDETIPMFVRFAHPDAFLADHRLPQNTIFKVVANESRTGMMELQPMGGTGRTRRLVWAYRSAVRAVPGSAREESSSRRRSSEPAPEKDIPPGDGTGLADELMDEKRPVVLTGTPAPLEDSEKTIMKSVGENTHGFLASLSELLAKKDWKAINAGLMKMLQDNQRVQAIRGKRTLIPTARAAVDRLYRFIGETYGTIKNSWREDGDVKAMQAEVSRFRLELQALRREMRAAGLID